MSVFRIPRLAVVMPVYNAERYLAATVESVLAQSYRDFVLVAVDDGSTDASAALLESVPDVRIQLHHQANSGGPACPRNVGINRSEAEYIALFDSDDLMHPEKLAEGVRVLDACPEAAFVMSNFTRIDEDGQLLDESFLVHYTALQELVQTQGVSDGFAYLPAGPLYEALCRQNFVGTSSVVLRRSVINAIGGFDETLSNSDDRDMWFRITRNFGAAYIPRPLHQYRVRKGSITARGGLLNTRSRIKVLEKQLENPVSSSCAREFKRQIAENYSALGYAQRSSGHRWASATSFLRALPATRRPRMLAAAFKSLFHLRRGSRTVGS